MKNLRKLLLNSLISPIGFIFLAVFIFFYPFFVQGKIPIPADTIVGMYHPWRDVVWDNFTTGVPFKNFLITDPVRQQYVWRELAINELKKGNLPLWNPYSFSGTPLLANFQSAPFYPLNILFFILPFNLAWGTLVVLQPLLAGLFLYAYLRFMKVGKIGSLIGALSFAFSGFSIAWLEWNTILHTALWLPLILLSIEQIIQFLCHSDPPTGGEESLANARFSNKLRDSSPRFTGLRMTRNKLIIWILIFLFSLVSSFFAGHLQVFFYVFLLTTVYLIIKLIRSIRQKKIKVAFLFLISYFLFLIITSIQWLPTLQFIKLSARDFDQGLWTKEGWFIPWQNLVQFLAPDFFGNPATGNYWGIWNYGEFIGYVGIIPLIMALLAMIWRRDKKTIFFGTIFFLSLIFATPSFLAKIPYSLSLPFISTSQPTRLLFLIDFSLAVLAAFGFDYFLKTKSSMAQIIKLLILIGLIFTFLWLFVLNKLLFLLFVIRPEDLMVAKRNLILPTLLFVSSSILLLALFKTKNSIFKLLFVICFLLFVSFDLFRFGWKFTPFVKTEWIFPQTEAIKFLTSQPKPFRFMTTDRRIFPPNFSTFYHQEDISGYDPLYLRTYGELVAAWNRGKPDISPASFNRILTPQDYSSKIADLLNVKYVLSLKDEFSPKLKLVFKEGEARIYENKNAFSRAYLVYDYKIAKDRQEAADFLFDEGIDLRKTAILEENLGIKLNGFDRENKVTIVSYESQKIVVETESQKPAILIVGDNFYPGWQAFLDGREKSEKTFRVNFTLRGIFIPEGKHRIEFYPSL